MNRAPTDHTIDPNISTPQHLNTASEVIHGAEVAVVGVDGGKSEPAGEVGDHGDGLLTAGEGEAGIDLVAAKPADDALGTGFGGEGTESSPEAGWIDARRG